MSSRKKIAGNKSKQESAHQTETVLVDQEKCDAAKIIRQCARTGNIVFLNKTLSENPGGQAFLDKPDKDGGKYPLHWACVEGQAGFAVELLDKGVNINSANANGYTALHYSAMWAQIVCLKILLSKGADINLKTVHDETAYNVARRYKRWVVCDELEKAADQTACRLLDENK